MPKLSTRLIIIIAILLVIAIYFISERFFAYSNDAYITTDLIQITPQVDGFIIKLNVENNQLVNKGEQLLQIDPTPF